jgi:hypothetical protein
MEMHNGRPEERIDGACQSMEEDVVVYIYHSGQSICQSVTCSALSHSDIS